MIRGNEGRKRSGTQGEGIVGSLRPSGVETNVMVYRTHKIYIKDEEE